MIVLVLDVSQGAFSCWNILDGKVARCRPGSIEDGTTREIVLGHFWVIRNTMYRKCKRGPKAFFYQRAPYGLLSLQQQGVRIRLRSAVNFITPGKKAAVSRFHMYIHHASILKPATNPSQRVWNPARCNYVITLWMNSGIKGSWNRTQCDF